MVFWKRTADFMQSSINATLSWLLPAAGVEAHLFKEKNNNNFSATFWPSPNKYFDSWSQLFLTLMLLCSSIDSERPVAQEEEHTAPALVFYEDYSPPAHRETRAKLNKNKNKGSATTYIQFALLKGMWRNRTSEASEAETECRINLTTTGRSSSCTAASVAMTASRTWKSRKLLRAQWPVCVFICVCAFVEHNSTSDSKDEVRLRLERASRIGTVSWVFSWSNELQTEARKTWKPQTDGNNYRKMEVLSYLLELSGDIIVLGVFQYLR